MILATQSLGDVDISSSTLSNIGLRIGMRMPEMDCNKILSIDNNIPIHFSRAGQAVYNTQNGLKSGNIIFQCAFLSKENIAQKVGYLTTKPQIDKHSVADFKKYIYDGNNEVFFKSNSTINVLIENNAFKINDLFADIYIGEPSYLQEDHFKFRLRKQVGSNLFLVGDDQGAVISIFYHSLFQLIKQSSSLSKFFVFELFDIDSGLAGCFERLKNESQNVKIFSREKPLEQLLDELTAELDLRIAEDGQPGRIIVAIPNLQRVRSLRKEGYDVSPAASKLQILLKDGPDYGIHVFLHIFNYNTLMDCLGGNILNEFENIAILKEENPSKYIDDYSLKTIKSNNTIYFKSPVSRYGVDIIKTYRYEK